MPRLASYILPPTGEKKKENTDEKSRDGTLKNYNTLIKFSYQQLLELLKSYSADQKSVKLVVKDHQIQGIKVADKLVCKVSNLKESRIDLFASLAPTSDGPTKCVGMGLLNGRLNPINLRMSSSGRLSDLERLSTKFKAIETLASQTNRNDHRINPSDLSKLLNGGVHPSTIRSIYKDIITKKDGATILRPECLSQISNALPTPEVSKYLTDLGYQEDNPFRVLMTNDKNAIPVLVKDHKAELPVVKPKKEEPRVSKKLTEQERPEQKPQQSAESNTDTMKIQPIDSRTIRAKKHQKSAKRMELHPVEPYPKLKPIPKHKTPKVAPYPVLSPVHKKETSRRDRGITIKRKRAPKESIRASRVNQPFQSEIESTAGIPRRKRRRRSLSDDKRSTSSSVSSSSASVRRSNQSSPLTPYTTEGEDDVTKTDLGLIHPKRTVRNELFGDDLVPLPRKRRVQNKAEIRQFILKFQDAYRRYYQLYRSLENTDISSRPLNAINNEVRTLISLENDLRCWKLELERMG